MGKIALLLFTTCLVASGCSDERHSYAEAGDENVFKGQTDTLEKAK